MKSLPYNVRVRPNYKRIGKALLVGLAILYIFNPVLLLTHTKSIMRYVGRKREQIYYTYIKETRGDLFYNIALAKKEWCDFGRDIKKIGQDFISFF